MTPPEHAFASWRYVPYWIGVKLGSPRRGTAGMTHSPLTLPEWKRWYRHGF